MFFLPTDLRPQGIHTIEYEKIRVIRALSGVVLDPSDAPMARVSVEEFTSDWKTALRSTETDEGGHFAMTSAKDRKVYFLQFSFPYFNPIRIRVRIGNKNAKELQLKMEPSA